MLFYTQKELPHPPLVVSPVSCPAPPKGGEPPASHPEADGEAAASTAPPREPASTPVGPEEEEPNAPFLEVEQEAKEEETDAAEPQPDPLPAQRPWGESPDDPLKDDAPGQMSTPAEHSQSG